MIINSYQNRGKKPSTFVNSCQNSKNQSKIHVRGSPQISRIDFFPNFYDFDFYLAEGLLKGYMKPSHKKSVT